jgi:small-conductance mechanosensitive channel
MFERFHHLLPNMSSGLRILIILGFLLAAHLVVRFIRGLGRVLSASQAGTRYAKTRTLASLATSILVFLIYFAGFGMIFQEFGVSLKAYLASASIMGLAIGFGSQGLVQDVVTGLTLVFADLFDVGDMVEISGQVGIVRSVGMRFTVLENSFGALVYIPNRTVANLLNYQRGYVRALVDVTLPADPTLATLVEKKVALLAASVHEQLPGLLITGPSLEERVQTSSGKEFLRVEFRIWPGRGGPLETSFKAELIEALKTIDPNYADWMVSVNYEVQQRVSTATGDAPRLR